MGYVSDELKEQVFRGKGRNCSYCTKSATDVDHYFPQNRSGPTEYANLEPACESCNSAKGDSVPHPTPGHPNHKWWIPGHPMNRRCRRYYGL